ncbi:MAG TPA: MBL fold metallo-hydrolase [Chloroflexota bacterium]
MRLTLLGTGNPRPNPRRAGPSQHVAVGGASLLVDCGSGVVRRMTEAGIAAERLDYLFITHHHSDHQIDLGHLLISGWVLGRRTPLTVVGPPGTAEYLRRVLHAHEFDLRARQFDRRLSPAALEIPVREVAPGEAVEGDGWRVTPIEVDHRVVVPAYGYRIEDERGRALVISGDTAPCDAVVAAAQGAAVLVHELNNAGPYQPLAPDATEAQREHFRERWESHTSAEQIGALAARSGVPTLVLSHLPPTMDAAWVRATAGADYRGELHIGEDLLALER